MPRTFLSRMLNRHRGAQALGSLIFNKPWAIREESLESIARVGLAFANDQLRGGAESDVTEDEVIDAVAARDDEVLVRRGEAIHLDGAEALGERGMVLVGSVAVVPITGPIEKRERYSHGFWGMTSYDAIRRNVELAVSDHRVRSILFDIDSPGGVVDGCFELVDDLLELRQDMPMKAIANGCACSAAYALGCAVGEGNFFATRSSETGSIGVIAIFLECVRFLREEGFDPHTIKSGAKKDLGSALRKHDEVAIGQLHDLINDHFEEFLTTVNRARGLKTDEIRALEAGVFIGERGVKPGLIDGVSTLEALLEDMNQPGALGASDSEPEGEASMAFKRKKGGVAAPTKPGADTTSAEGEDDEEMEDEDDEEMETDEDEAQGDDEDTGAKSRTRSSSGKTAVELDRERVGAILKAAGSLGISTSDPVVTQMISDGTPRADAVEQLIEISSQRGASRPDPLRSMRDTAPGPIAGGGGGDAGGASLDELVQAEMADAQQRGVHMTRSQALISAAKKNPGAWQAANAKHHQKIGRLESKQDVELV